MLKINTIALLALVAVWPATAQENWCTDQGWHNSDMVTHSEVREEHLTSAGQIVVNPAQNGSIHVHGGGSGEILVKACVQASARDEGSAEALAKQVTVTDGPGRLVAKGPTSSDDNSGWSVSYDIWVPSSSNLDMQTSNGSIHVEGTSGRVSAHSLNGSINLKDVIGDVEGETTNGSMNVDLISGNSVQNKGMSLKTVNGSIHLQLPTAMGAEVEASTVNGSVHNDFADTQETKRVQNVKFTIGSGGPKIEVETVNGSVRISRQS
jgi:hypothetical protein